MKTKATVYIKKKQCTYTVCMSSEKQKENQKSWEMYKRKRMQWRTASSRYCEPNGNGLFFYTHYYLYWTSFTLEPSIKSTIDTSAIWTQQKHTKKNKWNRRKGIKFELNRGSKWILHNSTRVQCTHCHLYRWCYCPKMYARHIRHFIFIDLYMYVNCESLYMCYSKLVFGPFLLPFHS